MWPFTKKPEWGCLPYEKPHEWDPFGDKQREPGDLYSLWVQFRTCKVCKLTQRRVIA